MAKQPFPSFMDIDLSKFDLSKFDLSKFDMSKFDLTKYAGDMKVPGFDVEAVVTAQKKNLETLTQANRLAFEGVQAIMKRQAEIARQTIEEISAAATQFPDIKANPSEAMAKQAAATKDAFDRALANMKELADMIGKSNTEVVDLLNARLSQSMEEVKQAIEKAPSAFTAPAAAAEAKPAAAAAKAAPAAAAKAAPAKAPSSAE